MGLLAATQTIVVPSLWGIPFEKNVEVREQLALDHIAGVVRAARATAAQRKKNQLPVEEAISEELEELFEDAVPNVGTPRASVSGRGNSPLVLTYAPQVGDLARDRLEPPGPAFGADGEMRPSSPIPVGSETLMFLFGFLQYEGFLSPDDVGDWIHSFA